MLGVPLCALLKSLHDEQLCSDYVAQKPEQHHITTTFSTASCCGKMAELNQVQWLAERSKAGTTSMFSKH